MVFFFNIMPVLALETGLDYGTATGLGTKDVREGTMNIISVLVGFLGILAIVIILWGGFKWLTSGGNDEKIAEAKKIIIAGLIGLIIIFASFSIATFVIKSLITATGAI